MQQQWERGYLFLACLKACGYVMWCGWTMITYTRTMFFFCLLTHFSFTLVSFGTNLFLNCTTCTVTVDAAVILSVS